MNLYGHSVEKKWINACLDAMRGEFTFADIEGAAIRAGCPKTAKRFDTFRTDYFSHRVADRILQQERRAGRIAFDKKTRKWQSNKEVA